MQVDIQTADRMLRAQAETRLQFYMTGLDGRVERVLIRIDAPIDRSGSVVDSDGLHHCQISALLDNGQRVEILETQADVTLAISRSIGRATRTIRRRLDPWPARGCA